MSGQAGRYQRSAAGMIGALLVLVAIIAAFVVLRDVNRVQPGNPVPTVDYRPGAAYARAHARFAVLAPAELPAGWRATSVAFTPGAEQHWHLGQLTDAGQYVGLEQGDTAVRSMLTTYVDPEPVRGGPVTVDGERWAAWSDSGGDRALVRRQAHTTTLVVGPVPQRVLVDYIRSLR